jgi:PKD repeat protein
MKKIVFSLFVIAFMACTKSNAVDSVYQAPAQSLQLSADFSLCNDEATVNEQEKVKLKNLSANAVSYLWDFGNGVTSTEQEPNFAYERCGNYTISLTVTGADGAQKTLSKQIVSLCVFGGVHDDE